jgi:hypothetical protein
MSPLFRDMVGAALFLVTVMYGFHAIPLLAWVVAP